MNSPRSLPYSYRFDWVRCLRAERRAALDAAARAVAPSRSTVTPRAACPLRPLSQLLDANGRAPLRAPCPDR